MNKAFSLIELLVVVAIIAILAAVAIPAYTQYKTRSIISSAVALLQSAAEQAAAIYSQTGSWPSSIKFGATSVSGWTLVNKSNIASGLYATGGDSKATMLGATLLNLVGISTYTAPSTTVAGAGTQADGNVGANTIYLVVRDVSGTFKYNCGAYLSGTYPNQSPPFAYMPSNCQCTDIQDYYLNGTVSTGCR